MNWLRQAFLAASRIAYERLARPLIFRSSAQTAHARLLKILARLDRVPILLDSIHRLAFEAHEIEVGGITLPSRFILAAGLVKGEGFKAEADALAAVSAGRNIIPGWRSVLRLVGLVEFGSFTRCPRLGNPGTVVWRDEPTRSTQNRVGLKNPGAVAAASFLKRHAADLPEQFGVNIAVSPGVTDPAQEEADVREAFQAFLSQQIFPTWFTLNISCPNTADDPHGSQTEDSARRLCAAAMDSIQSYGAPLWVKVSPDLSPEQYAILMRVFHEVGVRAVIATNTLPRPTPNDEQVIAGVGGGGLHDKALEAVRLLMQEKRQHGYKVDVIGCGGVMDGATYFDYYRCGVEVVQYWSALVYRGPLAAALIEDEIRHDAEFTGPGRTGLTGN